MDDPLLMMMMMMTYADVRMLMNYLQLRHEEMRNCMASMALLLTFFILHHNQCRSHHNFEDNYDQMHQMHNFQMVK